MDIRKIGIIPFLVLMGLVLARYVAHTESIQPPQTPTNFNQITRIDTLEPFPAIPGADIYSREEAPTTINYQKTILPQSTGIRSTNSSTPNKSQTYFQQDTSQSSSIPTRLVIPSLKVNTPIVLTPFGEATWNLDSLGDQIAYLESSPENQFKNNTVLAGHVTLYNGSNGPFRYLSRLEPGSKVTVYFGSQFMTYQVRDLSLVYPEETEVIKDTNHKELTLLTCTTWDEATKSYLRRLVVKADLVEVGTKIEHN